MVCPEPQRGRNKPSLFIAVQVDSPHFVDGTVNVIELGNHLVGALERFRCGKYSAYEPLC